MPLGDVLVAVVAVVLLAAAIGGLTMARLPDEEITRDLPGVGAVEIRLGAGRVEISERDRAQVRLRATVRRRLGRPGPRIEVASGASGGLRVDGVLRVDGRTSEARFRLELPRCTPVRAEVRHGEITLWGSDGDLVLVTEHGTVAGRELGGARVSARSKTGDVTLHFSTPPRAATAVSDSGSVTVVLPAARYDVEVETAHPAGAAVELPDQPAAAARLALDGVGGADRASGAAGALGAAGADDAAVTDDAAGADGEVRRVLARSRVGRVRVTSSAVGPARI